MTDRTALALAACQGLTTEELASRGPGSFAKMINRKRAYAAAARTLAASGATVTKELAMARKQLEDAQAALAQAQATIAQLEALEAPIGDTTVADQMIAGLMKGQTEE